MALILSQMTPFLKTFAFIRGRIFVKFVFKHYLSIDPKTF
ncbi:hypothetical protein SAMN05421785_101588 [Chryseobacterium gambrini]|uniref:Uncharacterized protein n=1 Tax=Chryseobacterium gambrini TaxID=373672 RepID=A0A1N7KLS4_9FLAO|nr:hypothetical protein SAMN05421785_101588 [Chryseobacterium gambrini]